MTLKPIFALSTALLAFGCLPSERPNLFGDRVERQELIEVTVENRLLEDVEIYAYWERRNTAVWLGVVRATSRETFTTRWWTSAVRFTRSDRVAYYTVRPGDHLEVVVGGATSMIPRRVND